MKLYNSIGPNPHVVRMFAAELGIKLDMTDIDLMAGENRKEPYLSVNPAGQLPTLVLPNDDILTEVTAICEYLDETTNGKSLLGDTPEERAQTRRWTRFVDINICCPMTDGFRFGEGLALFKDRTRCIPDAADDLKACAQDKLAWLDKQIDGKTFIGGDKLSLADIMLYCFLTFGAAFGQPLNEDFSNIATWFKRMEALPSASA